MVKGVTCLLILFLNIVHKVCWTHAAESFCVLSFRVADPGENLWRVLEFGWVEALRIAVGFAGYSSKCRLDLFLREITARKLRISYNKGWLMLQDEIIFCLIHLWEL